MYDKCGYIEIVGGAAEQAMVDAVQEVKNLPQYNADEGEVSHNVALMNYHYTIFSGSSLMQGTTPPPTPTILLCLVSLESMTKQFTCHQFFHILYIYIYSTHKILGISTYSRTEHSIPQTRELACTKAVLPQVRENRGLLHIWCTVHLFSIQRSCY